MQIDLSRFSAPCICGHKHDISVEGIWLEAGALDILPRLIKENGWKAPAVLCDDNTRIVAGDRTAGMLAGSKMVCLAADNLHANEHGVALAKEQLTDTDVMIAVGAGTIHDITRYIASERGIPFISVPTAASVDGFVSTVAAMTWQGCKKTFAAAAPLYVLADSDIFAAAPLRLNVSGICDLLGKYTALADWEIAHVVTGEYLCETICELERTALARVEASLEGVRTGDKVACEELMYGLLLSGLAMQMVGNSRPASGAEHHLSHLWEMELINPYVDALHGEKVGVGLLLAADRYHAAAKELHNGKMPQQWQGLETDLLNRWVKPTVLPVLIEENTPDPLASVDTAQLVSKTKEVLAVLDRLPSGERLLEIMSAAGAKCTMQELGLEPSLQALSLTLSPYVRNRLTFMRMLKLWGLN